MPVPLPLYSVDQIRELDRLAIAARGGDGYLLMQAAGAAAFRRLCARWPLARRIAVVCGRGNNGGDGYVLAALALRAGLSVDLLTASASAPNSADAQRARADFSAAGGVEQTHDTPALFATVLSRCDVVVDALFGIGLTRAPEPAAELLIEQINFAAKPVLALDVPSGINADTGHAPGACVRADVTVSFIGMKCGLLTGAAAGNGGELVLEDLGVEAELRAQVSTVACRLERGELRTVLPRRRRDAHKGDFGHVLVIGGDHGMGGAARMAGQAAARCGAGLVSVATRGEHAAALVAACPELMARAVDDVRQLEEMLQRATVVAIGPGLGRSDWSRSLLNSALAAGLPIVLDADALNAIAMLPRTLPMDSVLTPHPGEAARLLGTSTAEVQVDRYAAAAKLVENYGSVVVLKGAGTIIAGQRRKPWVCASANPGMASGGMGDVLTGVIAALMAQGLGSFDAARIGVLVHAEAAQRAARAGERGMLASDVIDALRTVVN